MIDAIGVLRGISSRGAQDGAAARENASDRVEIEGHALVVDQAAPAFLEADEFVFVSEDAFAHHGADHGIQAGTIPTAGQHTNLHVSLQYGSLQCMFAAISVF